MGKLMKLMLSYLCMLTVIFSLFVPATYAQNQEQLLVAYHTKRLIDVQAREIPKKLPRFKYDTGLHFEYPDAVRGVFLTSHIAGGYKNYLQHQEDESVSLYTTGRKFRDVMNMMETTDLNSLVIDVKDDWGNVTFKPDESSPLYKYSKPFIDNPREMLEFLEEKQIYPIARVVVFKDTVWAKERPDVSFTENGNVWVNGKGDAFVNPFLKEVWERNVQVAIEAAKLGFKEIQFDYVRFPEGFEKRDEILNYSMGDYAELDMDNVQKRVEAVTDFVAYAKEQLEYYDVDVSVDIFGYTATLPEAPGIGQNFTKISEHVDVISSMIYPSHWGFHYFNIPEPDMDPYRLVLEYAKIENAKLAEMENPPTSRPWLQDFEAPWLYKYRGKSTFQYGKEEVEAQIRALNEQGINEFLLWNAANVYTENVDFTPLQ